MTPNDIEILIHCHVSPSDHPRMRAPAVKETYAVFEESGMIEKTDGGYYRTTERGRAHVEVLCSTPWPTQAWIDQNGNVIPM